MSTILNRLNDILTETLAGDNAGITNVDAGNKINKTYDKGAAVKFTNAEWVNELRLVFKEGTSKDAAADYSKYQGGGEDDAANLFKQTLVEVTFPSSDYFSEAENVAQSMFYYFVALRKIDISKLDTSNWTSLNSTFYHCDSLEELIVPDDFISNDKASLNLDLRYSPLTLECAKTLMDKLANRKGKNAATVTLNTEVYNKLVADNPEIVDNMMINKNWDVTYAEA